MFLTEESRWTQAVAPPASRGRTRRPMVSPVFVALGDLVVLNGAFLLAYWLRFQLNLAFTAYEPPPFAGYIKALAILNYCFVFLLGTQGVYRRERFHSPLDEYNTLLKSVTASLFFLFSLTFFSRGYEYSRLVGLYAWFLAAGGMGLFRYALSAYETYLRTRKGAQFQAAIVGETDSARLLAEKFQATPELGYRVAGFIASADPAGTERLLGTLNDFDAIVTERHLDAVFIADQGIDHFRLLSVVETCERHGIAVSMVPSMYDLLVSYRDVHTVDGLPLVSLEENTIGELSLALKRMFDLVFASAVVVLTAPVWIVLAVAIKLDSPGPVLFVQMRSGKDGKPFRMLKFRTMVADAEARLHEVVDIENLAEPVFKVRDDPRVTHVGKLLRSWSLDELPQFLNVLWGNMSVVGPRPEEVGMVSQYNVWQRRRLKIKPGITGLQQITNRGCVSLAERIKFDIYYIRRQSLLLDLQIIVRTVWVVFRGYGAT